jgi:polyisoprenoid-binding protein YceI
MAMRPHFLRQPLIALLLFLASPAPAATFVVEPRAGSRMEFVSKAPMETFSGKTRELRGSVSLDPQMLGDSLDVAVEVDMASLDTGIDLRNRHMRENHLHTGRFPKATFHGGRLADLSAPVLAPGAPVTGTLVGTMELHGTQRVIRVPFEMELAGELLHVTSRFQISLADYGIPRPQFLVMRLDDIQRVEVHLEAAAR